MQVGFKHRHDGRMVQAADGSRFVQPGMGGVTRRRLVQELERHLALQAPIVSQPNRGLRTPPQLTAEQEAAYARGRSGRGS